MRGAEASGQSEPTPLALATPPGTGHASTAGEAAPEAGADESRDRLNGDSLIPAPPWARKNGAGDQSAAGGQQSERSRR